MQQRGLNQHKNHWSLIRLWSNLMSILKVHFHRCQVQQKEWKVFEYHPPSYPSQSDKYNDQNAIGVGVYQGELVVFGRQLLDIPSDDPADWEVCKPRLADLSRIAPEVPRLLHSVAFFLECEIQFCPLLKDLQRTSLSQQWNYDRYAILPSNCGFSFLRSNNTDETPQNQQIKQCTLIEKLLRDLESQRMSCPKLYELKQKMSTLQNVKQGIVK
jgi:hypothetical protein